MARSLTASLGALSFRRLPWFKRTLWTNDIQCQRVTARTAKSSSIPDALLLKHSESLRFHSQQLHQHHQPQQQQQPMGKTVVEIERRFRFDADTESKLAAAGVSLVSEKSFVDTYVGKERLSRVSPDRVVLGGGWWWLRQRLSPSRCVEPRASSYCYFVMYD